MNALYIQSTLYIVLEQQVIVILKLIKYFYSEYNVMRTVLGELEATDEG